MTQSGQSDSRRQTMEAFFAIIDMLRASLQLRYTFAGLIVGTILSLIYRRLAYGSLDSNAGDDALVIVIVVCVLVGMALDIRRGLKKRG